MPSPEPEYHPSSYWSRVAQEIGARGRRRDVAGDDDAYFRMKRRRFLRRFLSQLDVTGRVVAEIGCGPGGNLVLVAARQPAKLIGIDLSERMLELAAAATRAQARVPVELVKTDGTSIPLPDRHVDLAYTVTVLQHNTDPAMFRGLVREICRIARDSVVLIEDTGDECDPVAKNRDHVPRRKELYVEEVERHGFRAVGPPTYLGLRASRWMHSQVWKLLPATHHEGAPLPRRMRLLLEATLPVTRAMDLVLPETGDLTRFVFRRI